MATALDTYLFYDSGAGANVAEDGWRSAMRHMHGSASGVIKGFLNEFAVSATNTGMTVTVDSGECWIRGQYGQSTSLKTLAISTAHATLARIDRVILRNDFTTNRIELDVLTGTAAASPGAPTITQSSTRWETSLATVSVPAADTSIASSQVTDNRVYTYAQARYYNASAQSVPNATFTKALLPTIDYQSGDVQYNAATNDYTLLRAGLWTITGNAVYLSNGTGIRYLQIFKGGTAIAQANTVPSGAADAVLNCTAQYRFAVNDTIVIWLYQNSGGALSTNHLSNANNVAMTWVGP